jgi:hypothetical protein
MSRILALTLAATITASPALANNWHGGGTCGWCWAGFGLGVLGLGALYAAPYYAPPPVYYAPPPAYYPPPQPYPYGYPPPAPPPGYYPPHY